MAALDMGRRCFLQFTGLTGIAVLAAACEMAPPTARNEPGLEVMQLEYLGYELDDVHREAFGKFKDAEPDVDLVVSPILGSWPEMLANVDSRIAAGDPPDVTIVATYGLPRTWSKQDMLLDLQPFLDADVDYASDPVPLSLLNLYRVDDALYGMPKDYATHAMMYNRDVFDAMGVDYPVTGWTWADCLATAMALTTGEGQERIFGLGIHTQPWSTEHWFWANEGPGLFDRWNWDLATPTANDDRNKEALQWLIDAIRVHGVAPSPEQLQIASAGSRQVSGQLAMWMGTTIDTVLLMQNQDKLNWHVVRNPVAFTGGPDTTMMWTSGFGIVEGTVYPDQAFAFLKHMSIGSGALVLGQTGFSVPSGRPDGFLTDDMVDRGGAVFLDIAFDSDLAANDSLGTNHSELLRTAVLPHYEAAFLGQMTAAAALDIIQQQMETILAEATAEQY